MKPEVPEEPLNVETINSAAPAKALNRVPTAYVFWLGCLLQLNGLHRIYNGKIGTGLLWFFTLGLFGIGQLIDLFFIPNMVEEHNTKLKAKLGMSATGVPFPNPVVATRVVKPTAPLMVKLLKAAERRNGKLSVTQGVMDTGASFAEVETVLREMLKSGYVRIDNHPETGVVIYEFLELS